MAEQLAGKRRLEIVRMVVLRRLLDFCLEVFHRRSGMWSVRSSVLAFWRNSTGTCIVCVRSVIGQIFVPRSLPGVAEEQDTLDRHTHTFTSYDTQLQVIISAIESMSCNLQ